ncbi:MAG: hypothetical protein ACNS62_10735 [Candidatus Cyclobacteriaceae bacterium M3_2C_046]
MEAILTKQESSSTTMSVKKWIITLVLALVPVVGLLFLFHWAFSEQSYREKSNFAKASLIILISGMIMYVLFFIFLGLRILGNI